MTAMRFPEHLGDGAYVHLNSYGEVVLTANHHDPAHASGTVVLGSSEMAAMRRWIETTEEALRAERKGGAK